MCYKIVRSGERYEILSQFYDIHNKLFLTHTAAKKAIRVHRDSRARITPIRLFAFDEPDTKASGVSVHNFRDLHMIVGYMKQRQARG